MESVVFCLISVIAGLIIGFILGCSHKGLLIGLLKGVLIGALLAVDLRLLGGSPLHCWCLLVACLFGSIVATYIPDEHLSKRYFDLRRELDL